MWKVGTGNNVVASSVSATVKRCGLLAAKVWTVGVRKLGPRMYIWWKEVMIGT